MRPRYLICDKLSSMLDVSTQAALLEAIAAIQDERQLGVLLITHDRVLADTWCADIADIRELQGAQRKHMDQPPTAHDHDRPRAQRAQPPQGRGVAAR